MRAVKKSFLMFLLPVFIFSACEKNNLFSKLTDRGDPSSANDLAALAAISLEKGHYDEAIRLATKAIEADPALAAAYDTRGSATMVKYVDLSTVIANLFGEKGVGASALSVRLSDIMDGLRQTSRGPRSFSAPNSIFNGVSIPPLSVLKRVASDFILSMLKDNNYRNATRHMELSVVFIFMAAQVGIENDVIDFENAGSGVDISVGAGAGSFCSNSANDTKVMAMGKYMSWALYSLSAARWLIRPHVSNTVDELYSDASSAINGLLINDLPAGCRTTLASININHHTVGGDDPTLSYLSRDSDLYVS